MIKQGYELADVFLVPKHSTISSRSEVDLSSKIGNIELKIPILASPMAGIIGIELIKELGRLGGIGILHRFYNDPLKRAIDVVRLMHSATNFGVAVGLNDDYYMETCEAGANIICIDVANGYLDSVLEFTSEVATYIKTHGFNCYVMSGNVATYDGAKNLANYGADLIRVGIGSGQLCTTRMNTGVGVYQGTAIQDCSYFEYPYQELGRKETKVKLEWTVVADGGIKTSGDIVKALGLGADYVMIGSMFSNCFESDHNGKIQGMASREFQEQFYGEVYKSVEGIQIEAVKDISLEDMINELCWNIRSGFSYLNARNILELQENAEFIRHD